MSSKSKLWSSQPLFKVKISKSNKGRKCNSVTKVSNYNNKLSRENSIKIFISQSKVIKIPFPPNTLLSDIEEETRKMRLLKASNKSNELNSFLELSTPWNEADLFLSDTEETSDSSLDPNSVLMDECYSWKRVNGFMAFRAYNSQFGYGLKQNVLSSLLSQAWHSNPDQQKKWTVLSQQFNFVKPKCGFVEWVGQTYEREMMWCADN